MRAFGTWSQRCINSDAVCADSPERSRHPHSARDYSGPTHSHSSPPQVSKLGALAWRLRWTLPVVRFRRTLAHVTGLLAVPYGFTVSLWTAGAVPAAHFGAPGGGEIVAFVAGALVAFLLA